VEIVTDYSEVAVVGITEIVSTCLPLLQAMEAVVEAAEKRRPALAIVTDFPGFHLRLARKLKSKGIRNVLLHLPANSGRGGRAREPGPATVLLTRLCIFPFEEKFFSDGVCADEIYRASAGGSGVRRRKHRKQFCRGAGA